MPARCSSDGACLMHELEVYRKRRTYMIGVQDLAAWQLKVYAISYSGEDLEEGLVTAALDYAAARLRAAGPVMDRPGCVRHGFVIIHAGADAHWLLLGLWQGEILHAHAYRARHEDATNFAAVMQSGSATCVWELAVFEHERHAWLRHVLTQPASPDYAGYQGAALTLEVAAAP